MRSLALLVVMLVACAAVPAPVAAPTPTPASPPPPPPPSDAEIIAQSHAILDALDKADVATLQRGLAAGFVQVEGMPRTRAELIARLEQRKPGGGFIASRTWDKEKVVRSPDQIVFVGKAHEIQGGNESHGGGYIYDGWYTLQWVPAAGGWQVQLESWRRATEERDDWNEIYRNNRGFSREPNRLLVTTVAGKRPGAALDLAMGQGRNAIYLASQGWQVTGVDISDEGIRIAREQAEKRKLPLVTVTANVDDWDFGTNRWDLVSMIYTPGGVKWIEKIKPSLRKGGLIIIDGWAKEPDGGWGFAAGELAALFTGYEIIKDEIVEDQPDWAVDRGKLARFVARKP
jgi:hypothetical protein